MSNITENIAKIKKDIPNSVTIVAATKSCDPTEINEAIAAGIEIIGENYIKEIEEKYKIILGKVKIHCIGHIQTNKVKKAVELFDMIQTVDSVSLAKEINKRCKNIEKIMPVLIEVNIAKEENKHGCRPEDVKNIIESISKFENIKIKGIMTMGPNMLEIEKIRPYLKEAKKIFDSLKTRYNLEILSMGMSDSYKIAIEEGANMIRIGTLIFGQRK